MYVLVSWLYNRHPVFGMQIYIHLYSIVNDIFKFSICSFRGAGASNIISRYRYRTFSLCYILIYIVYMYIHISNTEVYNRKYIYTYTVCMYNTCGYTFIQYICHIEMLSYIRYIRVCLIYRTFTISYGWELGL